MWIRALLGLSIWGYLFHDDQVTIRTGTHSGLTCSLTLLLDALVILDGVVELYAVGILYKIPTGRY
jgi:hypothetical protein